MKRQSTVKTIETPIEDLIINVVSEPAFRDSMGRNIPEVHKASLRTTIPNANKIIANAFPTNDPGEFYLDLAGVGSTMKGALSKLDAQIEAGVELAAELVARIERQRTLSLNDERKMAMLEQRLQLLHDYLYAIGRM
jgi:hypothetical protein